MEPLSQFSDKTCRNCQVTPVALPFCMECHALQDCPLNLDPFVMFGFGESLEMDEGTLKQRLYQLVRALHPDQFSQKSPQELRYAVLWTAEVNRAYSTLKTLDERLAYLIKKYIPEGTEKKETLPLDLAESYFELQDLLESPEKISQIKTFASQIDGQITEVAESKAQTAKEWESTVFEDRPALLKRLKSLLYKDRYLHSMKEDIEKKVRG